MERQDRKKDHNSARNSRRRRPLRIWKEGESDRQRTKQGKQSSLKTTGEEKEESR